MNSTDKKSLIAFKAMFGALSQSVKRKFEGRALLTAEAKAKADAQEEPPVLRSEALRLAGANVVSIGGVVPTKTRT